MSIWVQPAASDVTQVKNSFIREQMPQAPEGYVKVYLFGLMLCTHGLEADFSPLGLPEEALRQAFEYWQKAGLVEVEPGEPCRIRYRLDAAGREQSNAAHRYTDLVERVTQALDGRTLAAGDVSQIYDWMQIYGLEEETVELLVRHCLESAGSARLTFAYLNTVARAWADAGVKSPAEAQEHLAAYQQRQSGAAKLLKLWGQGGRPTQPELELYEKWTSGWGFSEEAVLLAAGQTTGLRNPNFKYLNALLEDYRARGLTTEQPLAAYLKTREQRESHVRHQAGLLLQRLGVRRAPSREDRDQVELWLYDWAMPMEVLFYAAERSAGKNAPFAYMKKLVSEWQSAGVHTLAAARQQEEKRQPAASERKPEKRAGSGWDFPERQYSPEELDALIMKNMGELEP